MIEFIQLTQWEPIESTVAIAGEKTGATSSLQYDAWLRQEKDRLAGKGRIAYICKQGDFLALYVNRVVKTGAPTLPEDRVREMAI